MALLHNVIITAQVTYSQLVTMIGSSSLAPAHYYEITDYRTIYVQPITGTVLGGAASAVPSKPFSIIVRALTDNTLSTDAFANPTVDFPNANTWKLKYDINLPATFNVFASIDWPSVDQTIADNIADVLDDQFGYTDAHGLNPAQIQTYVDVTFAGNESITLSQAEREIYDNYNTTPDLPINTNPVLSYNSKYNWADSTSLGVIFEMTDENNNTTSYDFKNVRFVRDVITGETGLTSWVNDKYFEENVTLPLSGTADQFYTFNINPTGTFGSNEDASNDASLIGGVNSNTIGLLYETITAPDGENISVKSLNNNVFLLDKNVGLMSNNVFDYGSQNNTFGSNVLNNIIGVNATSNKINDTFYGNRIGGYFANNTIDTAFGGNVMSEFFGANIIASGVFNNTIGIFFTDNSVGINFNGNSIDENCQSNTFSTNCIENNIGISFQGNTIVGTFTLNQVATRFNNNTFNSNASSNTFGPEFKFNTIASGGSGFNANNIASKVQSCNFNGSFANCIVTSGFSSKTFLASNNFVYNLDNATYSVGSSVNATFFTTRANNYIMSSVLPNTGTLTGHSNVGITSAQGMSSLTSGSQNTAIGELSLTLLTIGTFNTGIGAAVLRRVTSGSYNTAIGNQTGQFIATTSYNTGFGGLSAGTAMGSFNIMLGAANITNLGSVTETIGDGNIIIGKDTQRTKNTVNNNIIIGNLSYAQNTSGTTIIGNSINTTVSNIMVIGGSAQNLIIGDAAPSADNGYRIQINAIGKGGIYLNGGDIQHIQDAVTGAATTSALNISSTWNTSGNITLIKANVINTASGTTSNLIDLQIGGVSKFLLNKSGQLTFGGYGSGTFTGTVTQLLAVTSTGAVVETTIANVSPWTVSGSNINNSNTGNVGIGTASPTVGKLQIFQNATASETTLAVRPNWNTSGTPTALEVNPQVISSTDNTSKLIDVKFSGASKFNVQQNGAVNLGGFGTGAFSGTPAKLLAVTSAGSVIEMATESNFFMQNLVIMDVNGTLPLTDADSNAYVINSTAASTTILELPDTSTLTNPFGIHYYFKMTHATNAVQIKAATGDIIKTNSGNSTSGGTATSAAQFNYIHLICQDIGVWQSFEQSGTWTMA